MTIVRSRNDPRREATRNALLMAAEELFSREGVRAVTIRQIAAAIGSANNNVMSYHFGGKDGLIDAVFEERLPELERRRAEILDENPVRQGDAGRLRFLANALWCPLFETVDAAGRRSYARFLRAVMLEDHGQRIGGISRVYSQTWLILDELKALTVPSSPEHFQWRLATVTNLVLDVICLAEEEVLATPADAEPLFQKALDMAVTALQA